MGRHVWDEATKIEALSLLADSENSYYDVHKATGVPASTLHDWAKAAGLTGHSDRLSETESARKFRSERIALKRAVLAEKFLDYAEVFGDQAVEVAQGMIEVKEGVFISGGRDAEALLRASTGALSAFRLEMGEATARTEHHDLGAASKARGKVDELAERRTKSA